MRVLWVKMGGLWPLNTGGRQRSFQILSELARHHELALVTTAGPGDDPAGLAAALSCCERVESLPYVGPKRASLGFARALARSWVSSYPVDLWKWRVAAVRRRVAQLVSTEQFDVIVADFLFAVANVPLGGPVPTVFFSHNVEYLIWKRLSEVEPVWWRRALLAVEWRKVRRCEARAVAQSRVTIAVSDEDRRRLAADAPGARVIAIPTGVDTGYFVPDPAREVTDRLVFSGSMDWYPNEDAVLHFVDAVLPRIRSRRPAVSFTIIGRNPSARVRALADRPGVRVTGTVPDVRPSVAEGAVYVVPLRVGGGTRLKIFEALSMGQAVVSTTIGAEGLDLVPDRQVVIADAPETFADAVVALLEDPGRRHAIGANGRQLVDERYSWARVAGEFQAHLQEATADHVRTAFAARRVVMP